MNRKQRRAARKQPRPARPGTPDRSTDPDAVFAEAVRLHQAGSPGEAERLCLQILAIQPDRADCQHLLGVLAYQGGRLEAAVERIGKALSLRPDFPEAHGNLGNVLNDLGRLDDAVACYRKAVALQPDFAEAFSNLGAALRVQGRLEEAAASCRKALELRPRYPEAHANLGNVLMELGRVNEAAACYEKALEHKPDFPEVLNNLATAYRAQGKVHEAIATFRKALELRPDDPELQCNLGGVFMEQGQLDDAAAAFRHAAMLAPGFAQAHGGLGFVLTELGRLPEAGAALDRAISLAPRTMLYRRQLAEIARFVGGRAQLPELERLAQDGAALPVDDRIELHFALARTYHDVGRYAEAFPQWLHGNALKRRRIAYDEPSVLRTMRQMPELFTSGLIESWRNAGDPSASPIFIVGMPRSGTSLVEQILGSHPQVAALGELMDMTGLVGELPATLGVPADLPAVVSAMAGGDYRKLGERYVARVGRGGPTAARVTDKLPGNFMWLGFIHLALPNARIVHVVRDPVDTCISCFTTLFTNGNEYTFDLAELGRYYRAYRDLMAHWRTVLPATTLLDVSYEDIVTDLEGQARRLIGHCGLDWDPRCLDFHRTERPVRTASAAQVRQPIYSGSVNRSRPYERFLGPLLAELG